MRVVGIGGSAGCVPALEALLDGLPARPGMAFVVAVHLSPEEQSRLPGILQRRTDLKVHQVTGRTPLEVDHIYLIPPDHTLTSLDGSIVVTSGEKSRQNRAPIDLLFTTLARSHGPRAAGIILSGTGSDGTVGFRRIRENGGLVLVQQPSEALFGQMAEAALETGVVDAVLPARGMGAELTRLREDPAEREALRRDLPLRGTGFFHDPEGLLALATTVITPLLGGSDSSDPIRVWVAGCTTGEEAYSVAILFDEAARTLQVQRDVRVFATDVSAQALEAGRTGRYPQGVAMDVSPARLERYFTPEGGGFRIRSHLRQKLVFAQHDLLSDPPFSSLDLVVCRDVLSHLEPQVRRRVLGFLRFSLKDDGHLFLGNADTTDHVPELFSDVDPVNRILRPRPMAGGGLARAGSIPGLQAPPSVDGADDPVAARPASRRPYVQLHHDLVELYAPPSLVITEDGRVVHLSGSVGRFLKLRGGEPSSSLLDLLEGDRAAEMRILLDQAFSGFRMARGAAATFGDGLAARPVVRPFRPQEQAGVFALVLFEPVLEDLPDPDAAPAEEVPEAEKEVQYLRERLSQASDAHDRTLQEFRAAYTELQIIYEEQMVTAEELESIREELQSVNEELRTINEEHRTKIEELDCLNADLKNLIDAAEVSAVFLDRDLKVRSYTPPVTAVFRFRASDVNRSVSEITHALDYPDFVGDAGRVLTTEERLYREVQAEDDRLYAVRMVPYRSANDMVDGVVVTFLDITERRGNQTGGSPSREDSAVPSPPSPSRSFR